MFFLQAAMAPVPLRYKQGIYQVPKMMMDELIVWATEVRTERLELATSDMGDGQRREHMALYPPTEPDIKEMSLLVNTPSGIKRVLRACLPKAKGVHYKTKQPIPELTDQEIEEIFNTNSTGRMAGLAWELIDIKDTSQVNPYDDKDKGGDEDPTTGTRTEQ
jgi:hypothetical protein